MGNSNQIKYWVDTVCSGCGCHFPKELKSYLRRFKLEDMPKFWCDLKCRGLHCRESDAGFRHLFQQSCYSAKTRNKKYELDLQFLKDLWQKQSGRCAYTDIPMELPENWKCRKPFTVSIDRIDSTKDYLKDNVEMVCLFINFGKNGFTKPCIKHFIKMIRSKKISGEDFSGEVWHSCRKKRKFTK